MQLYRAIDESPASCLHVEKQDGRVVGFVTGGWGMGPIFRQMLHHPFALAIALAPLLLRPRKILGILEVLRRGQKAGPQDDDLPTHELLSIAVLPEMRGSGVAERLYTKLSTHFRGQGVESFRIVVGDALAPAHRFYRRMGAVPRLRTEVHVGQGSVIYVQKIGAPAF